MIVATPVDALGQTAHAWGKAHWVGVARLDETGVADWEVHETGWDVSHDQGNHGAHHARIVRFLRENAVEAVVVNHMGEGMRRVMAKMGIALLPATQGDARASVLAAVEAARG
jgi:predicted Fe-Mo cluster-binding NifX family protein